MEDGGGIDNGKKASWATAIVGHRVCALKAEESKIIDELVGSVTEASAGAMAAMSGNERGKDNQTRLVFSLSWF